LKNKKTLLEGIEIAKKLQQAIVAQGTALIERKEVKFTGNFRYVFLNEDTMKSRSLFQFPLAVHKLALFIMQSYQVCIYGLMRVGNQEEGQAKAFCDFDSEAEERNESGDWNPRGYQGRILLKKVNLTFEY